MNRGLTKRDPMDRVAGVTWQVDNVARCLWHMHRMPIRRDPPPSLNNASSGVREAVGCRQGVPAPGMR
jgi:hypothetical protein